MDATQDKHLASSAWKIVITSSPHLLEFSGTITNSSEVFREKSCIQLLGISFFESHKTIGLFK